MGVGIATAIKLTPAVFIGYLIVTRRWRAAAVAAGTSATGTGSLASRGSRPGSSAGSSSNKDPPA